MSDVLALMQHATRLHQMGQLDGARAAYKQILASMPRNGAALHGLGLVLAAQGNLKQAHAMLKDAAKAMPGDADVLANLARVCLDRELPRDAASAFRAALKIEPGQADLLNGLGAALEMAGDADRAQEAFLDAHALRPDVPAFLQNAARAFVLRAEKAQLAGRWEDSMAIADAGLAIAPSHYPLLIIKSHALLIAGKIREGVNAMPPPTPAPAPLDAPQWDGSAQTSARLAVRAEQGVGDQLIFASVLPDLATKAPHLIVECDRRFVPLFARSFPGIEFVGWRNPPMDRLREADVAAQTTMRQVCALLRPDLASFPPPRQFLLADDQKVAAKRQAYRTDRADKIVGIAWASANTAAANQKSIPLDHMAKAAALVGVRLLSLQYGDHAGEIARVSAETGIEILQDPGLDPLQDLDAFAAAVAACDAVVTSSNAALHFAGALGVPAWGVLPAVPYWHWFADRDASPWYAGVRLVRRQANETSWQPALKRTRRLLMEGLEVR